jgi:PleD family two-component response regulator
MGLVPIIVASNLGQKEDIERALELGAVDFLVKSEISIDALVQKILKYKQSAT